MLFSLISVIAVNDQDADSIPDESDKCPDTSPLDAVESNGCPTNLEGPNPANITYEPEPIQQEIQQNQDQQEMQEEINSNQENKIEISLFSRIMNFLRNLFS